MQVSISPIAGVNDGRCVADVARLSTQAASSVSEAVDVSQGTHFFDAAPSMGAQHQMCWLCVCSSWAARLY
jgi:hypothetical protein